MHCKIKARKVTMHVFVLVAIRSRVDYARHGQMELFDIVQPNLEDRVSV